MCAASRIYIGAFTRHRKADQGVVMQPQYIVNQIRVSKRCPDAPLAKCLTEGNMQHFRFQEPPLLSFMVTISSLVLLTLQLHYKQRDIVGQKLHSIVSSLGCCTHLSTSSQNYMYSISLLNCC